MSNQSRPKYTDRGSVCGPHRTRHVDGQGHSVTGYGHTKEAADKDANRKFYSGQRDCKKR